ncbi:MAG: hypothetical protein ACK5MU_00920 [Candidatus Saccharimonadales bacterium]
MENQDSVSIIESPREAEIREAEEKAKALAAIEAEKNKEIINAEKRKKTRKIVFFVFCGILGAALLVALIWFAVVAISSVRTPAGDVGSGDETPSENLPIIAGYQCTTGACNKITDLPDGRILMRDTAYYIYDSDEKVAVKTTIPEKAYHAIVPFVWGDETLAILDPDTGRSALYSITRNQQVGEFNYDDFITDTKAAEYADMQWIIGKYIIAKQDDNIRLLDVFDGSEVVRAQEKVFARSPYFFGYDGDGVRRVYLSDGTRILSSVEGEVLFMKDSRLIKVSGKTYMTLEVYDQTGTKLKADDDYFKNLRTALSGSKNYATSIAAMSGAYKVPTL